MGNLQSKSLPSCEAVQKRLIQTDLAYQGLEIGDKEKIGSTEQFEEKPNERICAEGKDVYLFTEPPTAESIQRYTFTTAAYFSNFQDAQERVVDLQDRVGHHPELKPYLVPAALIGSATLASWMFGYVIPSNQPTTTLEQEKLIRSQELSAQYPQCKEFLEKVTLPLSQTLTGQWRKKVLFGVGATVVGTALVGKGAQLAIEQVPSSAEHQRINFTPPVLEELKAKKPEELWPIYRTRRAERLQIFTALQQEQQLRSELHDKRLEMGSSGTKEILLTGGAGLIGMGELWFTFSYMQPRFLNMLRWFPHRALDSRLQIIGERLQTETELQKMIEKANQEVEQTFDKLCPGVRLNPIPLLIPNDETVPERNPESTPSERSLRIDLTPSLETPWYTSAVFQLRRGIEYLIDHKDEVVGTIAFALGTALIARRNPIAAYKTATAGATGAWLFERLGFAH